MFWYIINRGDVGPNSTIRNLKFEIWIISAYVALFIMYQTYSQHRQKFVLQKFAPPAKVRVLKGGELLQDHTELLPKTVQMFTQLSAKVRLSAKSSPLARRTGGGELLPELTVIFHGTLVTILYEIVVALAVAQLPGYY